jgi:hypothetical protein
MNPYVNDEWSLGKNPFGMKVKGSENDVFVFPYIDP